MKWSIKLSSVPKVASLASKSRCVTESKAFERSINITPTVLRAHYMEDLSPGLKFQLGTGLKFCSDYMENFSLRLKNFSPVLCWFYMAGKFFSCLKKMAASRKSIQCLSFMFELCTILMMLILQLNTIIIMFELLGRKKIFCK